MLVRHGFEAAIFHTIKANAVKPTIKKKHHMTSHFSPSPFTILCCFSLIFFSLTALATFYFHCVENILFCAQWMKENHTDLEGLEGK